MLQISPNRITGLASVIRVRWHGSILGRSLNVLNRTDQKKVLVVTFIQISMGALDLFGVLAIGLLGALSVSGVQTREPGTGVGTALEYLRISHLSFQNQASIIAIFAVVLLVGRTILSILFTRKVLFFLSRRGAQISADLVSRLLAQSLLAVQSRTTQETVYAVTKGVELIVLQVLATSVVLAADLSLLVIMAVGLFVIDPTTAVGIFIVFFLIGVFLYRFMHIRAYGLGVKSSELNIRSNEKIVEVFGAYRESVVRNRRAYYAGEIGKLRFQLSDTTADINFLPYVSKYVIETTVILGALLVGLAQFILQDATHAIATLAVFLAAGTRIAPAVLRVQQGTITIRGSLGQARPTLNLIESLGDALPVDAIDNSVDTQHVGFLSEIRVNRVTLTYPGGLTPAISNVSLDISAGISVAVVGSSGAGKTTLIDILLGVLKPDNGSILISGLPPLEAISRWPGAISYVPQDVVIAAGTIRENVALGYPPEAVLDELVMNALKVAHLDKFVQTLQDGIDTQVGERGAKISGGERQRLGIARAMFTNPYLLVLDEATSSLDGETEASISDAIHALRGTTTVVMIAHRLSTVRNADLVVYMSDGKIVSTGSFDEVRRAVPDFDRQAKLMSL